MLDEPVPISELLNLAAEGNTAAEGKVFSAVYGELLRLAAAQRARLSPGNTLDTTAVVHEAYLRLAQQGKVSWNGRHHFFCTAARSMRDILVEEARRKGSLKRGAGLERVDLDELAGPAAAAPEDLIALDAALQKLEKEDVEDFEVVILRYFIGLSVMETAEVLGVSHRAVERRWRFCRSWLARELDSSGGSRE